MASGGQLPDRRVFGQGLRHDGDRLVKADFLRADVEVGGEVLNLWRRSLHGAPLFVTIPDAAAYPCARQHRGRSDRADGSPGPPFS